jgi:hypothetical protein
VVLDRDAAVHATVAVAIMTEPADRVEYPHRRPHGDGEVPGEDPAAIGTRLRPGVADLQRQMVGEAWLNAVSELVVTMPNVCLSVNYFRF